MAISTINATIQMRKGLEQDFDPDKMAAGEWAVSTDKKYVRMCFSPGLCFRMATYESFEEDMKEIQTILATCQNIQVAVDAMEKLAEQHKEAAAISAEEAINCFNLSKSYAIGTEGEIRENDNTDNSKYYSERAEASSNTAKEYVTKVEKAGVDAIDAINSAVDINVPKFTVDLNTGHLMYESARFDFNVNDAGHLEWGLIV